MRRIALVLAMLSLVTAPAGAAPSHGVFVLRLAADTIAVERFERTDQRVTGALAFRLAGARFDYDLWLAPDGSVTRMKNTFSKATAAPGDEPEQVATIEFRGDSAIVMLLPVPARLQGFATRAGAIPYVNPSIVMIEQVVRRAFAIAGRRATVPIFAVAGGQTLEIVVTRVGADSVTLDLGPTQFVLGVGAEGAVLGGSIPSQGVTIERVDSVPDVVLALVKPDYAVPAGAPFSAQEVRIPTRAGFELAGTLTLPTGSHGPVPCVVTITGSGAEERDEATPFVRGYRPFRQIADALARRNIAVLRLDDRGTGASGGGFRGATSEDFAQDVQAALRWLSSRRGIDRSRLALLGHREGGLIAPIVAERDPAVRAMVLMAAPAYNGRRILEYQNSREIAKKFTERSSRDSALRVAMVAVDSEIAADPWLKFFSTHDPLVTARRVRTPVLILHGATDRQVTAEQAELLGQAFRTTGNRDVTVRVLPSTNHLFLTDPDGEVAGYRSLVVREIPPVTLTIITDWLASRLAR